MSFCSMSFLVFIIAILALLPLIKRKENRHILLLLASYYFYGSWDWRFCGLLGGLTVVTYICAKKIASGNYSRVFIIMGIAFPLIVLGAFKYFNFFRDSFLAICGKNELRALNIILPVGISFYTFQSISYVMDVYHKKVDGTTKFLDLALYISFFPQLVAGPIVKAADFLPQLKEDRNVSFKNLEIGVQIFLLGAFKKIVLADHIAIFVDEIYNAPGAFAGSTVLLAVTAYSVQIYCDFSGYSDMAIGSAKCIGYDLPHNFNVPYLSRNLSEFWKRWHISLSTWLQEYLYIPLGGNRKGKMRMYGNLVITMLLGGLWHGANWTFIIWGGVHGIGLCIHKKFAEMQKNKSVRLPYAYSLACTFSYVTMAWIFFRAESVGQVAEIMKQIVSMQFGIRHIFSWALIGIIFVIIECIIKRSAEQKKRDIHYLNLNTVSGLTLFFLEVGLVIGLAYTGASPFIYFQF